MRPIFAAVFGLLFLSACTATRPNGQLSAPDVKVATETGHGSGVHIGNGFILTAAHIVGEQSAVTLKTSAGDRLDAEVLWASEVNDVALLRVDDAHKLAAADLECRVPQVGETITAKGNPLSMEFVSVWGRIAGAQREFGPWRSVVITDIATAPGQSGGAVYDQDGDMIGITVGVAVVPIGFSRSIVGIGYAIPGRTVCNLLARKA